MERPYYTLKCNDPKSGIEEVSVVTRGLDKLIQYSDFIRDYSLYLRLYLSYNEKNGVTVQIHCAWEKTITNEMKRKGDTVSTTSKKIRRVTPSNVTEFSWKTYCFYCGSLCVPDQQHDRMSKSSVGKLIVSIADLRVFQILNILNVKKAETFVHCLSSRVNIFFLLSFFFYFS